MSLTTNCNGSGTSSHCGTRTPHKHCVQEVEVWIIATKRTKIVGDCWDTILDGTDLCENCTKEANGESIHRSENLINESRTGLFGANYSGSFENMERLDQITTYKHSQWDFAGEKPEPEPTLDKEP